MKTLLLILLTYTSYSQVRLDNVIVEKVPIVTHFYREISLETIWVEWDRRDILITMETDTLHLKYKRDQFPEGMRVYDLKGVEYWITSEVNKKGFILIISPVHEIHTYTYILRTHIPKLLPVPEEN